jgi:hypothetical protein
MDGPYIFIHGDVVECYSINTNSGSGKFEITEQEIALSDIINHRFTCHIDNSYGISDFDNFDFNIYPDNIWTDTRGEYEQPEKLLAISDIEGNFYALQSILLSNNVMDKNCNWTYGSNHLVILGDLIDRGTNVFACLWLIYKLDMQANEHGGKVHYILGNHELMNFNNDFRYVHQKYFNKKGVNKKYIAIFNHSSIFGNWIRSKNTIEKIGDYLFVHAGLSKQLMQHNLSIQEINELMLKNLGKKNSISLNNVESLLLGSYGPLWFRGLVNGDRQPDRVTKEDVINMAHYFNVKKIVVGHTVVSTFKKLYEGMVFAIDIIQPYTKNSKPTLALLIEGNKEYVVDDRGNKKQL